MRLSLTGRPLRAERPLNIVGGARNTLLGAALSLALLGLGSAQVQAQAYLDDGYEFGLHFAPHAGLRPREIITEGRIPVRALLADLRARGFREAVMAGQREDVVLIDARDARGLPVRLVVDAYEGDVLARIARADVSRPAKQDVAALPAPSRQASLPLPPRRPSEEILTGSIAPRPVPAPKTAAKAGSVTRPSTEWAPINSVPVAPLD